MLLHEVIVLSVPTGESVTTMWSTLGGGGGGGGHDEGQGDNSGQARQLGSGLWSRFKQVATEVATDLAQPTWNEEEEEEGEYYEDEAAVDAEDAPWEQEQPYQEGGEVYDDDYVEEEENDGWGEEEEEVDFLADEIPTEDDAHDDYQQTQYEQNQQTADEQPLLQQPAVQQNEDVATDDWDLDDEDLGISQEAEQPEYSNNNAGMMYQEQQQQEPVNTEDQPIEEQHPEGDANAWGQDDSFDFDDSHNNAEIEAPEGAKEVVPQASHDTFATAEQQRINTSGWSDDLGFPDDEQAGDQQVEDMAIDQEVVGKDSHESYYSVEHHEEEETDDAVNEAGDTWNDDLGDIDISEAQSSHQPGSLEPEPTANLDASANHGEGDDWGDDDDLNLSDHDEEQQPATVEQPVTSEETEVSNLEADADSWGDDDLRLSDSHGLDQEQPATSEEAGIDNLDADGNIAAETDAWGDDDDNLNLSDHQDQNQEQQSAAAEQVATSEEAGLDNLDADGDIAAEMDAWGDDANLNLSDHQDQNQEQQSAAAEQAATSEEAGIDTLDADGNIAAETDAWSDDDPSDNHDNQDTGATLDTDPNLEETGDAWGEEDLNLSEHQEVYPERTGSVQPAEEPATTQEDAREAWDEEDLNLSGHDAAKPEIVEMKEPTGMQEDSATPAYTWGEDEINLSEHQDQETHPADSEQPANAQKGAAASYSDLNARSGNLADASDAWGEEDNDLSEHQDQEPQPTGSEQPTISQENATAPASDLNTSPKLANARDVCGEDIGSSELNENRGGRPPADLGTDTNTLGSATDRATAELTWYAELNLSLPLQPTTNVLQPINNHEETNSTAADRANAGAAWYSDLDLSSAPPPPLQDRLPENPAAVETVTTKVNVSADEGGAWGDGVSLSDHPSEPQATDEKPTSETEALATRDDGGWDDDANLSEHLDESEVEPCPMGGEGTVDELEPAAQTAGAPVPHEDDDSTVEQSNTAFAELSEDSGPEQISEIPHLIDKALEATESDVRPPSRRATLRVSNTSYSDAAEDEEDANNERIVGTSVMFAEPAVSGDHASKEAAKEENSSESEDSSPGYGLPANLSDNKPEEVDRPDANIFRETFPALSENNNAKPLFETQISMMTLKSVADSVPSVSRQHDNDSDDDDERGASERDSNPH